MTNGIRPRLVAPGTPLSRPLIGGHLALGLALHSEGAAVPIDPVMLEAMGHTPAQAFAEAERWLAAHTSSDDLAPVDTVPGMWFLSCHDGDAAVRLHQVPHLLQPLGGLLAAVPSRNQLLLVPVDTLESVEALRILASAVGTAYDAATDPVSDQLYWHDGDSWVPVRLEREPGGDVTVLPPPAFFDRVRQVASMELVRVVGEA